MAVRFIDNTIQVESDMKDAAIAFLYESALSLQNEVVDNSRRKTGETAGKWSVAVDESALVATVGNPSENAIWEEFGTGEFAFYGNGRRGGWYYQDDAGEWHHTYGKSPTRAFWNAYLRLKRPIERRAQEVLESRFR